jgi:hypothetical protein
MAIITVVLTILKSTSQWEGLDHILWKITKCLKPPTGNNSYIIQDPTVFLLHVVVFRP